MRDTQQLSIAFRASSDVGCSRRKSPSTCPTLPRDKRGAGGPRPMPACGRGHRIGLWPLCGDTPHSGNNRGPDTPGGTTSARVSSSTRAPSPMTHSRTVSLGITPASFPCCTALPSSSSVCPWCQLRTCTMRSPSSREKRTPLAARHSWRQRARRARERACPGRHPRALATAQRPHQSRGPAPDGANDRPRLGPRIAQAPRATAPPPAHRGPRPPSGCTCTYAHC